MLNYFNNCIFMLSNMYFWPRNKMGKISSQLFGNINQDNFNKGIFIFNALLIKSIFIGSALSLGTLYLGLLCVLPFTNLQKAFNRFLSLVVSLPLYSAIILPNYVKFIFKAFPEIKAVHNDGIIKNFIRSSKLYYHLLIMLSHPKDYQYPIFFNENVVDQYRAHTKVLELIKNFNLPLLNIKNWSLGGFLKESTIVSNFGSFYYIEKKENLINTSNLNDLNLPELNKKLYEALNSNNKKAIFHCLYAIINKNKTLNVENPIELLNLNLDGAKLIKLLIESPLDTRTSLRACLNSIPKASRNTFISDNELAYHCVNKGKYFFSFAVLSDFIEEHDFNKVLNWNFIIYALTFNFSIASFAYNKMSKLERKSNIIEQEDTDLKEFCELVNLKYSEGLTSREINTAYRQACRKFHPDKNLNDLMAKEKFYKLQECKNKLRNAF